MPDDFKLRLKEVAALLPEFRAQATAGAVHQETVAELRDAWGNPFTPPTDLLMETCRRALRAKTGILECGSGLTTALLIVISEVRKTPFAALEHSEIWIDIARKALSFLKLPEGLVKHAPLKHFGGFDWYDINALEIPPAYDFVLCDGPPGVTHGGRSGLFPVMWKHFASGCVVLLDDADRDGEKAALGLWRKEYAIECEFLGGQSNRYALIRAKQ